MRRFVAGLLALALLFGVAIAAFLVLPVFSGDDSATVTETPGSSSSTTGGPAAVAVQGVEGEMTITDGDGVANQWKFLFVADGSYRVEGPAALGDYAYDADTRTASQTGDGVSSRLRNLAPGPPDGNAANPVYFVDRPLGWLVRALAGAADPAVSSDTFLHRPAWRYEAKFASNKLGGPGAPDEIRAIVDRQTAFPVSVTRLSGGNVVESLTVERLVVNPTVPAGRFVLANDKVAASDEGFEEVQRPEAAARAGFVPLVPDVGDGFAFDEVAVARTPGGTGPEGSNPNPGPVVSESFRRGIDQITVSTRATGPDASAWADPFGGEGMSLHADAVPVTKGALAGSTAQIVLDAQSVPHAFVVSSRFVVTVAGAIDRAGLVAAMNSLHEG